MGEGRSGGGHTAQTHASDGSPGRDGSRGARKASAGSTAPLSPTRRGSGGRRRVPQPRRRVGADGSTALRRDKPRFRAGKLVAGSPPPASPRPNRDPAPSPLA